MITFKKVGKLLLLITVTFALITSFTNAENTAERAVKPMGVTVPSIEEDSDFRHSVRVEFCTS